MSKIIIINKFIDYLKQNEYSSNTKLAIRLVTKTDWFKNV